MLGYLNLGANKEFRFNWIDRVCIRYKGNDRGRVIVEREEGDDEGEEGRRVMTRVERGREVFTDRAAAVIAELHRWTHAGP